MTIRMGKISKIKAWNPRNSGSIAKPAFIFLDNTEIG